MPLSAILNQRIQRLVPHEGLVVDVPTWNIAHNYHVEHQRLHAMAMHGPGVVTGLEVVSWEPPDNSIVINPGVAVDAEGRAIIVGEPQRFRLQTNSAGTLYFVLQYREVPGGPTGTENPQGAQPLYLLEAYMLQVMPALPEGPHVELARVHVSGNEEPIKDAGDPFHPGENEIDTRSRMVSGPRPLANVNIGVVPLEMTQEGQITHAEGAMNLVRTINNTTRYRAEFKGSINVSHEITDCDLLLLSGRREFHFASEWVTNVSNFIDRGGVLLGQSSRAGIDDVSEHPAFRQSFIELAGQLSVTLRSVERNSPILNSFNLFAELPDGVDGRASTVAENGVIYTDADYGALWEGGKTERPASRESIRSAMELGVNIAVYASNRTQLRVARLAAH